MNIVLIGFMGSGKSTVGRLLAERRSWVHRDTDEIIAAQEKMPVGKIIREKGESEFRRLERQTVALLAGQDKTVISTGGGVPLDPENMRVLGRNGAVVWLRVSSHRVLHRIGDARSRPLIDPSDPLGSIEQRLREREPLYAKARYTIDVDDRTPEQIAAEIDLLVSKENS